MPPQPPPTPPSRPAPGLGHCPRPLLLKMPRPRFLRTEELLESPGFQQKLEGQQAETMRAMEACIDDVFKEIAEGLEVHVDQSQLEEKMRGAVRVPNNNHLGCIL